jgi:hypothetical protein
MPIMCPACGAENPDHAEYCNLCMSTVGFECAEYTGPTDRDEGFRRQYPSSFDDNGPVPSSNDFTQLPPAKPVDVGRYGVRSGEHVIEPEAPPASAAKPVDIGRYGAQSGHEPHEAPRLQGDYGYEGLHVSRRQVKKEARRRRKERSRP